MFFSAAELSIKKEDNQENATLITFWRANIMNTKLEYTNQSSILQGWARWTHKTQHCRRVFKKLSH